MHFSLFALFLWYSGLMPPDVLASIYS